jgi:hypothetical protein
MALVMGKQCCNNARWKKLLYPENSGLYLIPIMQLKKNGREKKEKKSGLLFYEGLTHPSLLLCRPQGLFFRGKEKKEKKKGLLFYEGLTHPSLSLCRPLGFQKITTFSILSTLSTLSTFSTFSTLSTLSTLFYEGLTHLSLLLCRPQELSDLLY